MVERLVVTAMQALSQHRPMFHSEGDFQLALAWEMQSQHPGMQIRLEKRVLNDPRIELDVAFVLDGRVCGLELKYPRRDQDITIDGERFILRTGAPDLDRYDVLKDVSRLERLIGEQVIDEGCAVVLTNVPGLWQAAPRTTPASYDAFRLHEGRAVSGTVDWGPTAGAGTRTGRTHPIRLVGRYQLRWREYSTVGNRQFRYLAIPVPGDDMARVAS